MGSNEPTLQTALRGSSGAAFSRRGQGVVCKSGNDRVVQQGLWLSEHQFDCFPTIYRIGSDYYEMEALSNLPRQVIDWSLVVRQQVQLLETSVWSRPPAIVLNVEAHRHKVDTITLGHPRMIRKKLINTYDRIDWGDLKKCLTHGDPTIDNVMLRDNGDMVLIDPIPATPAIPDLQVVDLAKINQSLIGFEAMRYGDDGHWPRHMSTIATDMLCKDSNEALAVRYFTVIHLLRAHPYMPTREVQRKIRKACDEQVDLL